MDPLTIAGIATIVLTGALTKIGENALDGSLKQLSKLLKQKSPDTWRRIAAAGDDQQTLPEVIEVMATVIEEDENIKKVAEEVAQKNQSKPEIINIMKNVGMVVQGGTINNPTFNFN